jgi:hypothetical protein
VDGAGIPQEVPLALERPGWLVLGTSYAPRWRAICETRDGKETNLGEPVPVDGFANGWPVSPECALVRFRFGPQLIAVASYFVSGLAILVLVALLVAGIVRDRRRGSRPDDAEEPESVAPHLQMPDPLVRAGLGTAIAAGITVGLVASAGFALRVGVVLGPATVLFLLLGVNVRRLLAVATTALLAVVVVYVADPAPEFVGVRFYFAEYHLLEHWLTVGAIWCVAAACVLLLARRRARQPAP